jgi:hypothetical protein
MEGLVGWLERLNQVWNSIQNHFQFPSYTMTHCLLHGSQWCYILGKSTFVHHCQHPDSGIIGNRLLDRMVDFLKIADIPLLYFLGAPNIHYMLDSNWFLGIRHF